MLTASVADATSLRNVAIIAHVDHGKTSLVDQLLKQSGNFRAGELDRLAGGQHDLIMDTGDLERERGITILSKNCAVSYAAEDETPYRINIIDTPGHADFGGEVERVLRMADGCLLLIDAYEGPMPQTRFVLTKALEAGLKPVVVVNKCDRPDADPDRVVNSVFDLLVELGADDEALDFPTVYSSAKQGWATRSEGDIADAMGEASAGVPLSSPERRFTMRPVFEAIVSHVPHPDAYLEKPLRMQITTLDYSDYVGTIGIGRVSQGVMVSGSPVALLQRPRGGGAAKTIRGKIGKVMAFEGLGRRDTDRVYAGDLCAITGFDKLNIGDTICDPDHPDPMDAVAVDEPTITMTFKVNDSPFAGQEGDFVTSRQVRARLDKELLHNVALRVSDGQGADEFRVSGRGVLHLGILIETMRREGYEVAIGRPEVITREIDGVECEPIEELVVDCPTATMGGVMQLVGERRGTLLRMEERGSATTHMVFEISSRMLIGLRGRVLTATQGEAVMHHTFLRWEPVSGDRVRRQLGVLISSETGQVTSHALESLADRGVMFVKPGDAVYSGQIVGEHSRDNDLTVNACRLKQLNNIRSANKEAFVVLKAPRQMSLEQCLEYVDEDELVEVTPKNWRIRKKLLDEGMRRRAERQAKDKAAV